MENGKRSTENGVGALRATPLRGMTKQRMGGFEIRPNNEKQF
jgi:hypothetical protein